MRRPVGGREREVNAAHPLLPSVKAAKQKERAGPPSGFWRTRRVERPVPHGDARLPLPRRWSRLRVEPGQERMRPARSFPKPGWCGREGERGRSCSRT